MYLRFQKQRKAQKTSLSVRKSDQRLTETPRLFYIEPFSSSLKNIRVCEKGISIINFVFIHKPPGNSSPTRTFSLRLRESSLYYAPLFSITSPSFLLLPYFTIMITLQYIIIYLANLREFNLNLSKKQQVGISSLSLSRRHNIIYPIIIYVSKLSFLLSVRCSRFTVLWFIRRLSRHEHSLIGAKAFENKTIWIIVMMVVIRMKHG